MGRVCFQLVLTGREGESYRFSGWFAGFCFLGEREGGGLAGWLKRPGSLLAV